MTTKMKTILPYFVLLLISLPFFGTAQEVPKGLEMAEIMKISDAYRTAADLSFDLRFTYADSATANNIEEQLDAHYKIHEGKYWSLVDSVEFLQGGQYNMAVNYRDSVVVVNNRQESTQVLQLPFLDSLFNEANVASLNVTRINDSTRSLLILFNAGSPYHSYEIQYDVVSYRIRQAKYYLADVVNSHSSGSGVIAVSMQFSNYNDDVVNETYFNEGKFVYRFAGKIKLQTTYSRFRLVLNGEVVDTPILD
jgi:hypothetical protein